MANEFIARNGITSLGNIVVSGSITTTGTVAISGSIASASFAATASSADNLLVRNTLTAQTLVVQTITSSVNFVTGSTRFGSLSSNTHVFTGSVSVSGSGTFSSSIADYGLSTTNIQDSSQGLLVRASDNDTSLFLLNAQSSVGATSQTWVDRFAVTKAGSVGIGTSTPGAPLEISYNNTSYTTTPILSLNNTNINGQTHINFLITGSLVGKIRSDYEGGMIYATNNRGADRAHYFLVNGDVGTGSVVMTIKANGKVGIGGQSPSSTLGITSTGADGLVMEPDLGSTNNSSRLFFTGSVQSFGLFNNSGDLRITYAAQPGNTSGTSFAKFANTGKYFRMEGSTGGIQFGGDTAAANALNDYEEGTWTPTIAGGSGDPTYVSGNRYGWYTKVGRVVTITWFISFTKNTLTATLRLTNFPFSLLNGPLFFPQGTVLLDTLGTTTNNITMQGSNNSNSGDFIGGNGTTSTHTGLSVGVLGAGEMQCRGTLTYFTA
jgi:hypothetical protein